MPHPELPEQLPDIGSGASHGAEETETRASASDKGRVLNEILDAVQECAASLKKIADRPDRGDSSPAPRESAGGHGRGAGRGGNWKSMIKQEIIYAASPSVNVGVRRGGAGGPNSQGGGAAEMLQKALPIILEATL